MSFTWSNEKQLTNKETAEWFREYFKKPHGWFSWPTDGCGYIQSVRFAQYRNEHAGEIKEFSDFALAYADKIENEPDTLCLCIHPNEEITPYCYCCDEKSCRLHGKSMW